MAAIYAMSDIHGELGALSQALKNVDLSDPEAKLVLLGDLIDHSFAGSDIYLHIMHLQEQFPGQIVAIMGNIDRLYMEQLLALAGRKPTGLSETSDSVLRWLKTLDSFYETENQIFVHAGIDEEAWDLWRVGTDRYTMEGKYPPAAGRFLKDIVAGHVGARDPHLAGFNNFHGISWDGESHFYIDGSSEVTHFVPLLKYDTETGRYTTFKPDAGHAKGEELEITLGRPNA